MYYCLIGENMNAYINDSIKNVPRLYSENENLVKTYQLALKNLLEINTVDCPSEIYNKTGLLDEELGLMIRAGGSYDTPWTRDAAVNTMNAACFLEPKVAKNTLWAVCERTEEGLCFQMDNQSWDKIVWTLGAWKYYLATGDVEFLTDAYETVKNSMKYLEKHQFNSTYGLFTGGSFFNDGITGYPASLHEEGNMSSFVGDHPATYHIMTLSTNCLYYQAYLIFAKMDAVLQDGKNKAVYEQKAADLKQAINDCLWNEERGSYDYLLYPDGSKDHSQEGCGISFAILSGVCNREQAQKILKNCYRSRNGILSIWPPFEGISSVEKPARHNNLVWPVVNGFFVSAAANLGCVSIVKDEVEALCRLALNSDGFYEIYNGDTGEVDGGWQSQKYWKSVFDQTWSATGFIRSIVFGVFGITLDESGISFSPCLPESFEPLRLDGVRFRDILLDVTLRGKGSHIASMTINGEAKEKILFSESGNYRVEIIMSE